MTDKPVAIVTGASRGIGAETAVHFARRGYDVTLTARTADALEAVAQRVTDAGTEALVQCGDLVDLSFAEGVINRTVDHFGRLDVLVNNAAWREILTMRTLSVESWEKTMRVCLTTPAFLAKWAAVQMEKQGRGVIINVSSIQSERPAGMAPAYIAAKGGLDSLTYDLAVTYGPSGVRVVAINPGAIDTEMSRDYSEDDTVTKAFRAWGQDMIPLKRWGTPQEIARTIVWLAGDEASYITGTTIFVDGGLKPQFSPYSIKRLVFPKEY